MKQAKYCIMKDLDVTNVVFYCSLSGLYLADFVDIYQEYYAIKPAI
jgi:hypothetical protein